MPARPRSPDDRESPMSEPGATSYRRLAGIVARRMVPFAVLLHVAFLRPLAPAHGEPPACFDDKMDDFQTILADCKGGPASENSISRMKRCLSNAGMRALSDYSYIGIARIWKVPLSSIDIDVASKDDDGTTIVCYALRKGDIDTIKFVAGKKLLDVDTATSKGLTPLMIASRENSSDLVKLLIERHANVNAKDRQGMTALMYAAGNGNREIVTALLKNFADATAADNAGRTALFYACSGGHGEIVRMMEGTAKTDMDFTGLASFYLAKGNPALARKHVESALALNPRNERAWFAQGNLYEQAGNYAGAGMAYRNAVELDPRRVNFWYFLAMNYRQVGEYDQGLEAVGRALELKPDDPKLQMLTAQLYLAKGYPATALKYYGEAHALKVRSLESNKDADNYNEASWYSLFVGSFPEAEVYARTALEIAAGHPLAASNLGHALLLQNRWSEALREYCSFLHDHADKPAAVLRYDFSLLRKRYPEKAPLISWAEKTLGLSDDLSPKKKGRNHSAPAPSPRPADPNKLLVVTPLVVKFSLVGLVDLPPKLLGQFVLGGGNGNGALLLTDLHNPAKGVLEPRPGLDMPDGIKDLELMVR